MRETRQRKSANAITMKAFLLIALLAFVGCATGSKATAISAVKTEATEVWGSRPYEIDHITRRDDYYEFVILLLPYVSGDWALVCVTPEGKIVQWLDTWHLKTSKELGTQHTPE